jgi:hypothetical protein
MKDKYVADSPVLNNQDTPHTYTPKNMYQTRYKSPAWYISNVTQKQPNAYLVTLEIYPGNKLVLTGNVSQYIISRVESFVQSIFPECNLAVLNDHVTLRTGHCRNTHWASERPIPKWCARAGIGYIASCGWYCWLTLLV